MRTLLQYINEFLSTKTDKDPEEIRKEKVKSENDPNTWEVGDILCGTFGATMTLPRWFKIIKRTNKQFTCIRLKGQITSGHRNGQWREIATDEPYSDVEFKGHINKWGSLRIDDVLVHLWDGKKELYGDDMD